MTYPMPDVQVTILDLGLVPYQRAWDLQKRLQRSLIDGGQQQFLILCEHNPVITLGRRAKDDNILVPKEELGAHGVAVFDVERGGDVTWHGPGQLVAYPILNLSFYKRDVHWYMRALEEVILRSLAEFGIEGFRVAGKTGVWLNSPAHTEDAERIENTEQEKIASIGVRLSRWCTLHGISLNVHNDDHGFSLIHPCGLPEVNMTSMVETMKNSVLLLDHMETSVTGAELLKRVKRSLVRSFNNVFVPGSAESTLNLSPSTKEKMNA